MEQFIHKVQVTRHQKRVIEFSEQLHEEVQEKCHTDNGYSAW